MYDSDHQHHHHSRITFCYRMEKNPGHGIHRSNGALLSKISGKLQPSPPPFSFWLFFLVSSPKLQHHYSCIRWSFPPWYTIMQCSAFEKLGNKKPPCFPPLLWISLYGKCANGFFLYVGGTLGGVALVLQDICSILVIHEMLLLVLNSSSPNTTISITEFLGLHLLYLWKPFFEVRSIRIFLVGKIRQKRFTFPKHHCLHQNKNH